MKSTRLLRRIGKHWQMYLFLLLPLIYLLTFCYYPMLGLQLAFRKFTIDGGIWASPWIGWGNISKFLTSYQFKRVLTNTLILSFYSIFAGFPLPIIFALLLNSMRGERMKKAIQTITYIPHFISVIVMVGIIMQVFNARTGLYGVAVNWLTGAYPGDLLGSTRAFAHLYVWTGIWQTFGWNSIIFIAALAAVSAELHEAAEIDGASRFQRVLHIDLPSILPVATIMLILRTGSIMNIGFEKIYLMQNSLNLSVSEVISTYVYKIGLGLSGSPDYSYSTAIGLFNSVINFLLIASVNTLSGKMSKTSLW